MNTSIGAKLIADERSAQATREGWTPDHDAEHSGGELVDAAVCYALQATGRGWLLKADNGLSDSTHDERLLRYQSDDPDISHTWPWTAEWWKPKFPIRDLVRAGALIAAEIDRRIAAGESAEDGTHAHAP